MDQRAIFFLGAAFVCALLIPVTDGEHRWVPIALSVVYVLWLIRGGVLIGSYLSALPAWRFLDPLPVLARVSGDEDEEDDDALDAHADKPADPLRGTA